MSYDLQIWSVFQPDLAEALPKLATWEYKSGSWYLSRRNWQIVAHPSRTLPEDVPAEVSNRLPGVQFCSELRLEPIHAPDSARKQLFQVARTLSKSAHGVILDRQTDEFIFPSGVRRFIPRARPERFSIITLGWWFVDDKLLSREGIAELLKIFQDLLPEALPRRYGLYEPPQFSASDFGRDHLVDFLYEKIEEGPVIYTTRPVLGLSLQCTREKQGRLGFKSHCLSVEVEASVVEQPGWQLALRRFWLELSSYLDVFYSEARTLDGFLAMGPTYGCDAETEDNPIRSWFWRGIPERLGHALTIGPRYLKKWPEVLGEAKRFHSLYVLDTDRWGGANNLRIKVPKGLLQVDSPRHEDSQNGTGFEWVDTYPEVWPFADFTEK